MNNFENYVNRLIQNRDIEVELSRRSIVGDVHLRNIVYSNSDVDNDPVTIVLRLRKRGLQDTYLTPEIRKFRCIIDPIE
ncbi:MAG: hypothetical protein ACOCTT_01335 [archaeon]